MAVKCLCFCKNRQPSQMRKEIDSYRGIMAGRIYFLNAKLFHLPAIMICRSEAPAAAMSVALPILNEWVLNSNESNSAIDSALRSFFDT